MKMSSRSESCSVLVWVSFIALGFSYSYGEMCERGRNHASFPTQHVNNHTVVLEPHRVQNMSCYSCSSAVTVNDTVDRPHAKITRVFHTIRNDHSEIHDRFHLLRFATHTHSLTYNIVAKENVASNVTTHLNMKNVGIHKVVHQITTLEASRDSINSSAGRTYPSRNRVNAISSVTQSNITFLMSLIEAGSGRNHDFNVNTSITSSMIRSVWIRRVLANCRQCSIRVKDRVSGINQSYIPASIVTAGRRIRRSVEYWSRIALLVDSHHVVKEVVFENSHVGAAELSMSAVWNRNVTTDTKARYESMTMTSSAFMALDFIRNDRARMNSELWLRDVTMKQKGTCMSYIFGNHASHVSTTMGTERMRAGEGHGRLIRGIEIMNNTESFINITVLEKSSTPFVNHITTKGNPTSEITVRVHLCAPLPSSSQSSAALVVVIWDVRDKGTLEVCGCSETPEESIVTISSSLSQQSIVNHCRVYRFDGTMQSTDESDRFERHQMTPEVTASIVVGGLLVFLLLVVIISIVIKIRPKASVGKSLHGSDSLLGDNDNLPGKTI